MDQWQWDYLMTPARRTPEITDKMTTSEQIKFKEVCEGKIDFYDIVDTPLFEKLYEYYLDSGEMPYGVAKARTGTPDEWICDRLEQEYFND